MKKHIETVHEGKKPHLCSICGSGFPSNKNLKRHISAVHDKDKLFTCVLCGVSFARKDNLKAHVSSVHEGIKPSRRSHNDPNLSKSEHRIDLLLQSMNK